MKLVNFLWYRIFPHLNLAKENNETIIESP